MNWGGVRFEYRHKGWARGCIWRRLPDGNRKKLFIRRVVAAGLVASR